MRWMMRVAPVISAAMIGCVHAASGAAGDHNPNLITEDEISASGAATAYDAVKMLRGNFLSYRGKTSVVNTNSPALPVVFLDDQEFGPMISLHSIPASSVVEIRLYRSWEAATRFGAGKTGGVIAIATRH